MYEKTERVVVELKNGECGFVRDGMMVNGKWTCMKTTKRKHLAMHFRPIEKEDVIRGIHFAMEQGAYRKMGVCFAR